jgi:hypothetical protein
LTTVLSILLVLAIAAATVAVVQQQAAQAQKRVAQQQLRIATARQLITEAAASLDDDPLEALQLGIAAQAIEDNTETRANLVTSLISTPFAGILTGHGGLVGGLAFSPSGKLMVSCMTTAPFVYGILLTSATPCLLASPFEKSPTSTQQPSVPTERSWPLAWGTKRFTCGDLTTPSIQCLSAHLFTPTTVRYGALGSLI